MRQRGRDDLRAGSRVSLPDCGVSPERGEKHQSEERQHERALIRWKKWLRDRDDRYSHREHYGQLHKDDEGAPRASGDPPSPSVRRRKHGGRDDCRVPWRW